MVLRVRPRLGVLLVLLLLSGCTMTQDKLVKNAAKKAGALKSYYAEAEAVVFSPEGEQRYSVRQWVQAPGFWRVEVKADGQEQVFLCDGSQVFVYQPGVAEYYRFDAAKKVEVPPPFLLIGYLEDLLRAPSLKLEGRYKEAGRDVYIVSFTPVRQDENTKVCLDRRDLFPLVVETFREDEILYRLTCTKLQLNPRLEASLFIFFPPAGAEVTAHCLTVPISLEEAKSSWVLPLYVPQYLPEGSRLFSVTLSEEDGCRHLIQIYDGISSFTLIQREKSESPVQTPGMEEVTVGGYRGLFRRNISDGLNTLYWSDGTSDFVLTGFISLPEMLKVAESLRAD